MKDIHVLFGFAWQLLIFIYINAVAMDSIMGQSIMMEFHP